MMNTRDTTKVSHPMVDALGVVRDAIAGLAGFEPVYVPEAGKRELLEGLVAAKASLDAVLLKTMAASGDVADRDGAKDVGSWLAATRQLEVRHARADQRLAVALESWTATATVLAAGRITVEQARAITHALDDVADDLDAAQVVEAEQILLEAAKQADAAGLRKLGRHLADVVDPEAAEEREAQRLAEEEKHADQKARLSLRPQGDGTTRVTGRIADATAKKLETFLESFAQPRKQAAEADGRRVPYPRLLARALGDLMDRIDPDQLPAHGGDATTVVVTITLDQLTTGLGAAGLGFDDDHPITVSQARRMACQAHIFPIVLGGPSQVLDAARQARLHGPVQRKVIRLRDKTCRADGCTVKAQWCEIHHLIPWSQGGRTSVKDGVLLCSHHHHRIHDPDYSHQRLANGKFRIIKRV